MYSTVVVVMLLAMTACNKSQPQENLDETACEFKDSTTLQNDFYRMVREKHGVYESGELSMVRFIALQCVQSLDF